VAHSLEAVVVRYRVTVLTPTLIGDGQKLSPIDYMVWKDHVNVLDQHRIFKLLARGPRLESYLVQLKKAEKLDFASWGGFAQNYAGRRIPFEHASSTQYWERTRAEHLFIPTFATGPSGPYLPATSVKGALRTGVVHAHANQSILKDLAAKVASESRVPRNPAGNVEDAALGTYGADVMRLVAASDSNAVPVSSFKVYVLRTSTLESRAPGKFDLAWKQSPRGAVKRFEDATPVFAEMASPNTVFEGDWREDAFLSQPEIARSLRRRGRPGTATMFQDVNSWSTQALEVHQRYAEWTGMTVLQQTLAELRARLEQTRQDPLACILPLGWGAGLFSKTAFSNTEDDGLRQILRQVPFYSRAIQSGLPFPKTRRVVFLGNQPATLAGFVELRVSPSS
jgi:CRISPR-associated protein Csm5